MDVEQWKDSPLPELDLVEGARLHLFRRYRGTPALCGQKVMIILESQFILSWQKNRGDIAVVIESDEPQHAVTPGQVAVLWEHDWCLESGIIGATF